MVLILAIVWVPRWFHAYGIFFLRRSQYVGCTQYMATRTAILDVKIVQNQCLEEIAKREAPIRDGWFASHPVVDVGPGDDRLVFERCTFMGGTVRVDRELHREFFVACLFQRTTCT